MNDVGLVCAILAAGEASRMGSSKSSLTLSGLTFIERALLAANGRRTVVVAPPGDDVASSATRRFGAVFVENPHPERGMTHSLRLADEAIGEPEAALAVLLVDMPLVDARALLRVASRLSSNDVAYPVSNLARPGHPVVFGPRARAALRALPDGDTLRLLRDDPSLTREEVLFDDDRCFSDVDTVNDLERIRALSSRLATADASSSSAASVGLAEQLRPCAVRSE